MLEHDLLHVQITCVHLLLMETLEDIVSKYTYLGLLLTEFLSYKEMAKAVGKSASRALGLLIAKYIKHMVISI